jgi:hypothetical protein
MKKKNIIKKGHSLFVNLLGELMGNFGIGTLNPQRTLYLSTNGQITFGNNGVASTSPGIWWYSDTYGDAGIPKPKVGIAKILLSNTFAFGRRTSDEGIDFSYLFTAMLHWHRTTAMGGLNFISVLSTRRTT